MLSDIETTVFIPNPIQNNAQNNIYAQNTEFQVNQSDLNNKNASNIFTKTCTKY